MRVTLSGRVTNHPNTRGVKQQTQLLSQCACHEPVQFIRPGSRSPMRLPSTWQLGPRGPVQADEGTCSPCVATVQPPPHGWGGGLGSSRPRGPLTANACDTEIGSQHSELRARERVGRRGLQGDVTAF